MRPTPTSNDMADSTVMDTKPFGDFSLGDALPHKVPYLSNLLGRKFAIVMGISSMVSSISDSVFLVVLRVSSPGKIAERIVQPTFRPMQSYGFTRRSISRECQKDKIVNWFDFNLPIEDYPHHVAILVSKDWIQLYRDFSESLRALEGSLGIDISKFISKISFGIWDRSHIQYVIGCIGKSQSAYA